MVQTSVSEHIRRDSNRNWMKVQGHVNGHQDRGIRSVEWIITAAIPLGGRDVDLPVTVHSGSAKFQGNRPALRELKALNTNS